MNMAMNEAIIAFLLTSCLLFAYFLHSDRMTHVDVKGE